MNQLVKRQALVSSIETKTLVITARAKPTSLATIAKFLEQDQQIVRTIGTLVSKVLEDYCRIISGQFPELEFRDTQKAAEFLRARGLLSQNETNQRRLFQILAKENLQHEQNPEPADPLAMVREAAKQLQAQGMELDSEQLEAAQLTLVNGLLVKNEELKEFNAQIKEQQERN